MRFLLKAPHTTHLFHSNFHSSNDKTDPSSLFLGMVLHYLFPTYFLQHFNHLYTYYQPQTLPSTASLLFLHWCIDSGFGFPAGFWGRSDYVLISHLVPLRFTKQTLMCLIQWKPRALPEWRVGNPRWCFTSGEANHWQKKDQKRPWRKNRIDRHVAWPWRRAKKLKIQVLRPCQKIT